MSKKKTCITYHFQELENIADNYSGFSFESLSSLLHHHKDFYEVILVTKGEWHHTIDDVTTTLPIGSLLLFKPDITHVIFSESSYNTHLTFGVQEDYFEKFIKSSFPDFQLEDMPSCLTSYVSVEKRNYIEHLAKMIQKSPTSAHVIANEILFSCISDFMYSSTLPGRNAYVTDIIQKLNSHIYFNDSISDICKHYPIARPILLTMFKDATGMTIVQYKAQQKLEYACHLLQHTNISVSSISSHLQYDSLSYFVRLFKKTYGMTPSEYRKNYSQAFPS